jgi:invasion protein IalB
MIYRNGMSPVPRSHLLVFLLAVVLSAATGPASAGYVFFSHTFGDWTVLCWTDEGLAAPVGARHCSLKAPPPKLEDAIPPQRGPSVVTISEQRPDVFVIFVQVPGVLTPGSPLYLRIDDEEPVAAAPNRYGEAAVTGDTAARLINAMSAGKGLVLRSFAIAGDAPRDETLQLKDFGEALSVYRQNLRTNGILAAGVQ